MHMTSEETDCLRKDGEKRSHCDRKRTGEGGGGYGPPSERCDPWFTLLRGRHECKGDARVREGSWGREDGNRAFGNAHRKRNIASGVAEGEMRCVTRQNR